MAKKDRSRSLEWGRALRPEISNVLSAPEPSEGSDGDMQVRNTRVGARLFAKLGGRWLSNLLYGSEELDNPNVFIPKVWIYRGLTASATTGLLVLPNFINVGNLISISYMHNFGLDKMYFWAWDTDSGATINSVNEIQLSYDISENAIKWEMTNVSNENTQGKTYKIAVFFK